MSATRSAGSGPDHQDGGHLLDPVPDCPGPNTRITKPLLYQGVLRVLFLLRPYVQPQVADQIRQLEQHYRQLAQPAG